MNPPGDGHARRNFSRERNGLLWERELEIFGWADRNEGGEKTYRDQEHKTAETP
jgi:hypothetical protein